VFWLGLLVLCYSVDVEGVLVGGGASGGGSVLGVPSGGLLGGKNERKASRNHFP